MLDVRILNWKFIDMVFFSSSFSSDSYNKHQCRLRWGYEKGGPVYQPKDLQMFEFTMVRYDVKEGSANYGTFGRFRTISLIH